MEGVDKQMKKNILFPSPVQMSQQPAILPLQVEYSLPTQHLNTYSCDITNIK